MPLLALITGPLGKIAGIAVVALALAGAGAWALHQHDVRLVAVIQAKQEAAARQAEELEQQRVNAAVDQVAQQAAARIAGLSATQKVIYAAPTSRGCLDSPVARAYLDSVRAAPGSGGGASSADTGNSVRLPSAAGGRPVRN